MNALTVSQPQRLPKRVGDVLLARARHRIVLSDHELSAGLLCRGDVGLPLIQEALQRTPKDTSASHPDLNQRGRIMQ